MRNDELMVERIISEIKEESNNLLRLRDEYREFHQKYSPTDKYLLRVKASFLSDFYTGVERIFKIVASELNGGLPKGDDWHKRLLLDMSLSIGGRIPLISKDLYGKLLSFLGFRHVIRQGYGFEINEKKMEELTVMFEPIVEEFIKELDKFCNFLRSQITKENKE